MARIRTIKPEFYRHYGLYAAEREFSMPLRVAFSGLWTACDRRGRFRWRPEELKLDCLPFDDVDFSRVLDALSTRGFVVKYAWRGKNYGVIPSFSEHQVINNREAESTLPDPEECEIIQDVNEVYSSNNSRVPHACPTRHDLAQGEGKGRERKGKEDNSVKDTSADAPVSDGSDPVKIIDPGKVLFDEGVKLLGLYGHAERRARPIIAKWQKEHGTSAALNAVLHAGKTERSDIVSFIEGSFRSQAPPVANQSKSRAAQAQRFLQGVLNDAEDDRKQAG